MDELTKCGKFRTGQKSIVGWDVTQTKNVRAIGLKTAQENNDKYQQRVMCSSVGVALCLLPAEKLNVKRNC
jgi:hypothetical protein